MPLLCTDIKNFVFDIFGNSHHQLNFAVIFLVNQGKYQNILPTPVCGNSPSCMLIGMVFVDRDAFVRDAYFRDSHVKNERIIFNLVASTAASEFYK